MRQSFVKHAAAQPNVRFGPTIDPVGINLDPARDQGGKFGPTIDPIG